MDWIGGSVYIYVDPGGNGPQKKGGCVNETRNRTACILARESGEGFRTGEAFPIYISSPSGGSVGVGRFYNNRIHSTTVENCPKN